MFLFSVKSVVPYAAIVCCSKFGGRLLLGSSKCLTSMGIAVGTSTVVHYTEEVHYWEGSLSEVPLYFKVLHCYCLSWDKFLQCKQVCLWLFRC